MAGAVAVSVTDAIGCVVEMTGTVSSPTQLQPNAISTNETMPGANDGTASVSPVGGTAPYTVNWSNGSNSLSISGLLPGNYAVTVTDANGCSATQSVTVVASTCFIGLQFSSMATTCPDAANGSATVSIQTGGSGLFSYFWSNGGTTPTIANLTAQGYTVTVTDATGCSATGQVMVVSDDTTPPSLVLQPNTTILLGADGSASLNPNDLVMSSSDNCSMVSLSVTPETVDCGDVGPVQVTVTASDNSGNETISSLTVLVKDGTPPVISCPANIALNGCGPVIYAMPTAVDECSGVNGISLNLTAGLASGEDFPVGTTTVTWQATDESQNTANCSFNVTVNYDLQVTATTTNPSCHGASDGTITLTTSGGQPPYSYNWSGGQGPFPAGNYAITITDFSGCSIVQTVPLTDPDAIDFQILTITPASTGQSNGIIDFEINGGTMPYTLTWLQAGSPLPNFNPAAAPAGNYQVRIKDANGCLYLSGLITVDVLNSSSEGVFSRSIIVSPNPSLGLFNLTTIGTWDKLQITVLDGTGRVVVPTSRKENADNHFQLDLQAYPVGIYWVKVVAGDAVAWKKVVKI